MRYKKLPFLSALEKQQVENMALEEAKGLQEKFKDGGHRGPRTTYAGCMRSPPPPEKEAGAIRHAAAIW